MNEEWINFSEKPRQRGRIIGLENNSNEVNPRIKHIQEYRGERKKLKIIKIVLPVFASAPPQSIFTLTGINSSFNHFTKI